MPFSSPACTLGAYADFKAKGKKINMAYVFDTARGIKLFADQAFYAVGSGKNAIAPFLLKKDAEAFAAKNGGKVLSFDDALKVGGQRRLMRGERCTETPEPAEPDDARMQAAPVVAPPESPVVEPKLSALRRVAAYGKRWFVVHRGKLRAC